MGHIPRRLFGTWLRLRRSWSIVLSSLGVPTRGVVVSQGSCSRNVRDQERTGLESTAFLDWHALARFEHQFSNTSNFYKVPQLHRHVVQRIHRPPPSSSRAAPHSVSKSRQSRKVSLPQPTSVGRGQRTLPKRKGDTGFVDSTRQRAASIQRPWLTRVFAVFRTLF
jgi:hypothetical protein